MGKIRKRLEYEIRIIPKKLKGYVGMNKLAAKCLGIKFPYKSNVFLIWRGLKPMERLRTIRHEKIEFPLIKKFLKQGLNPKKAYLKAHRIASALEKGRVKRKRS